MAQNHESTDLVALTSDVGTWMAVFLGLVALIGIVGPYLALRASLSDGNRAMNAIKDEPGKYVSHGFPLTRGLRVGRHVRVPNLSPSYISNCPDTVLLIPPSASCGLWTLKQIPDYHQWNSGWAKLSELIGAYRFRQLAGITERDLGIPNTGSLEVVNSRTALVAHKQWVVFLGLLGRYGKRPDTGVLQKTGIRRDLGGEVARVESFFKSMDEVVDIIGSGSKSKSRRRRRARSRSFSSISDEEDSSVASITFDDESEPSDYAASVAVREIVASGNFGEAQRNPWGGWTMQRPASPIHGITGSLLYLGRQMGSFSQLTCISFVPHTARQIFGSGIPEKEDAASFQTLFWLAHGFLPTNTFVDGKEAVICLESPSVDNTTYYLFRDQLPTRSNFFSLQHDESGSEIPLSMGNTMQCLGIPQPRIEQFLQTAPPPADELKRLVAIGEGARVKSDVRTVEGWVRISSAGQHDWFPVKDLERAVSAFLRLEWDPWGYLVWQGGSEFWKVLLREATSILRKADAFGSLEAFLGDSGGCGLDRKKIKGLRWRLGKRFHPDKTRDYWVLGEQLRGLLDKSEVQPLRVPLAVLFILKESFRKIVEGVFVALVEGILGVENRKKKKNKESSDMTAMHIARGKATMAHGKRKNVVEKLQEEKEEISPVSVQNAESSGKIALPVGIGEFLYSYDKKELRWQLGEAAANTRGLGTNGFWSLSEDLTRALGAEKTVKILPKEMVIVGLWAANCAALWLSSQDSQPLLQFVGKLDPHVYVL